MATFADKFAVSMLNEPTFVNQNIFGSSSDIFGKHKLWKHLDHIQKIFGKLSKTVIGICL